MKQRTYEQRTAVVSDMELDRRAFIGLGAAALPVVAGLRAPRRGDALAFVASGDGASVRAHDLRDGRVRDVARVPYGSYNVQAGAGVVVTPSLSRGTLTVLDRSGRAPKELKINRAAHDARDLALIGVIRTPNGYLTRIDRGGCLVFAAHGPAP